MAFDAFMYVTGGAVPADFAQLAEDLSPEDVRRVLEVGEPDDPAGTVGASHLVGDGEAFEPEHPRAQLVGADDLLERAQAAPAQPGHGVGWDAPR